MPIALALFSVVVFFGRTLNYFIAGELALSGEVRYVKELYMAILAEKMGKKGIILPKSLQRSLLGKRSKVFPVESLAEAVSFFWKF